MMNTIKRAVLDNLISARRWVHDAKTVLAQRGDRVDALDSIRLAREDLDKAEKLLRSTLPKAKS